MYGLDCFHQNEGERTGWGGGRRERDHSATETFNQMRLTIRACSLQTLELLGDIMTKDSCPSTNEYHGLKRSLNK